MNKYWLSWYHSPEDNGSFTLLFPWWLTGDAGGGVETICAAVKADSEEEAKQIIQDCYDTPQIFDVADWRFCDERVHIWTPFEARFPKSDWMVW